MRKQALLSQDIGIKKKFKKLLFFLGHSQSALQHFLKTVSFGTFESNSSSLAIAF